MKQRHEIILAGSGGQGLIISGKLLANAAIRDGKNVVQTQTYGIAQRGGFSAAEVIIDDEEILYHQVQHPNMIVVLNESVVSKYKDTTAPVLYDSSLIPMNQAAPNWVGLPFAQIAAGIGGSKIANLVAIGAMLTVASIVSLDSLVAVIRDSFPAASAERNIQAVYSGMKAAEAFVERV